MNHPVKIVCFYDIPKYINEDRVYSPATVAVIDYLTDCLSRLGYKSEIISVAETKHIYGSFSSRSEKISRNTFLTVGPTTGHKVFLLRIFSKIYSRLWLVYYLLNQREVRTVIFYDSPVLYEPLILYYFFIRKTNIKVIYFASEIFQEVRKLNVIKRKMEWYLFAKADKFILSTELLYQRINKNRRPCIILNGSYYIPKQYNNKYNDGLIHIVYAGVIRKDKGALRTVELAKYLNKHYCIHILGFGINDDIILLKKKISDLNYSHTCKVFYEGLKYGEDYHRFLQKCDIGLCPQNLNEKYNNSSFPSKILTYLANGLHVVSVDLPTIKSSKLGNIIHYTPSDDPYDIAKTIISIDLQKHYDSVSLVKRLDVEFLINLKKLFK